MWVVVEERERRRKESSFMWQLWSLKIRKRDWVDGSERECERKRMGDVMKEVKSLLIAFIRRLEWVDYIF